MSGYYLRKHGVALDGTTSGSLAIRIKLRQADSDAFATSAHWTPAAGDVKVSKDGGAEANIATLPTYANGWWSVTLSAAELTAKQICVAIDDAAVVPEAFVVETFGDVDADYADDLTEDGASQASVDANGTAIAALTALDNITFTSPIDSDAAITVRRARDYANADGRAIDWVNAAGTWPDLTGATFVVLVSRPGSCRTTADYSFPGSVVTPTGANQAVRLELTDTQLAIVADNYTYEGKATLASGNVVDLPGVSGSFAVLLGRDEPT